MCLSCCLVVIELIVECLLYPLDLFAVLSDWLSLIIFFTASATLVLYTLSLPCALAHASFFIPCLGVYVMCCVVFVSSRYYVRYRIFAALLFVSSSLPLIHVM